MANNQLQNDNDKKRVPIPAPIASLPTMPSGGYNAARVALSPNSPSYLPRMGYIGAVEGQHELNDATRAVNAEEAARNRQEFMTNPLINMGSPDVAKPVQPGIQTLMQKSENIRNRPIRTIAEIGTGALGAGEALGESLFPTVAARIPGSITNTDIEKQRTIAQQQQEEKNRLLAEAIQERPVPEQMRESEADKQIAERGQQQKDLAAQKGALVAQKAHANIYSNFVEHGMVPQFDAQGNVTSIAPLPGYADFQKALKGATGKNAGFMTMFAAYKFYNEAITENPQILPYIAPLIQNALGTAGIQAPKGFTAALAKLPPNMPLNDFGQAIGTHMPGSSLVSSPINTSGLFAQRFLAEEPDIRDEIAQNADYLGPVNGRVTMQFLLGKIGTTGNPDTDRSLEQLRANMGLVAANATKFHTGTVRELEHIEDLANANKLTPEALYGFLDSLHEWAGSAEAQGQGRNIMPRAKAGQPSGVNGGNSSDPLGIR